MPLDPWTGCDELMLGQYRDAVLARGVVVEVSSDEAADIRSYVVGKSGAGSVRGRVIPLSTRRILHHGLFDGPDGRGLLALPWDGSAIDVALDIEAANRNLVSLAKRIKRLAPQGRRRNPPTGICPCRQVGP